MGVPWRPGRAAAAVLLPLLVTVSLAAACTGEGSSGPSSPTTSGSPATPDEQPADAPLLGASHALLPDPAGDGVLLLTGPPDGSVDDGPMGVWRWDGDAWQEVPTAGVAPSARNFFSATYDQARGRVVLYGGATADGASDETWEWDGERWRAFDGPGPGALMSTSLAFDPASGRSVLYGGNVESGAARGATWAWDGRSWTQLSRQGPTPLRWPAAVVADAGRVVLYGGHQVVDEQLPPALGDTWTFADGAWTEQPRAGGPGTLVNSQALVHPEHGVLLVAGSDLDRESGDVWRWEGDGWRLFAEDVFPPRQAFGLALDESRQTVVLTGGVVAPGSLERHQDVWEWSGDPREQAVLVDERPPA